MRFKGVDWQIWATVTTANILAAIAASIFTNSPLTWNNDLPFFLAMQTIGLLAWSVARPNRFLGLILQD